MCNYQDVDYYLRSKLLVQEKGSLIELIGGFGKSKKWWG